MTESNEMELEGGIVARAPDFEELQQGAEVPVGSLAQLKNIEFDVEAVLGRAVLPISDILKLGTGSVVELDRTTAESAEIVVQGVTVARGDVVVVGDSYAIRIKEIIPQESGG